MTRFATVILLVVFPTLVRGEEPIRERIEWADIWVTDADKSDLPRVLLIGDSITRGYFDGVEKQLAGKAYCARLTTSKCAADPSFLDEVQLLLKQYRLMGLQGLDILPLASRLNPLHTGEITFVPTAWRSRRRTSGPEAANRFTSATPLATR